MELYKEILSKALSNESITVKFDNLKISANEIVELECYKMLMHISEIIKDEQLDDTECFNRIEKIISLFEQMCLDCGYRHDFI